MGMLFRTLTQSEIRLLDFWERNISEGTVSKLNAMIEHHDEIAVEAGPYGQFCEITRDILSRIANEIEAEIECMTERYDDWASD